MKRLWILMWMLPLFAGCGVMPDAYTGCDKVRPYEVAEQVAPLDAPSGADLPDTRNALRIPEIKTPEVPVEPGKCLEHPPSYGPTRPPTG